MTTLHPTKSSRGPLRGVPVWAVVVVGVLLGALLIGGGLLLTNGKKDDKASPSAAAPTCTPTPAATSTPPKSAITINVYNSTSRAGLARDTADSLAVRNFTIADVTNDPEKATIPGTAVVRYVPGSGTQARWVAAQVPGATIKKVSATGRTGAKIDLVIGNGYTALATTPQAKAAFTASGPRSGC